MSVDLPSSTLPAVEKRSRSLACSSARNSSTAKARSARAAILEITLALLDFHGAFLVVIDHAILALAAAEANQLFDDFWQRVGVGTDCAGAGAASEGAHAAADQLGLFAGEERDEG